MYDVFQSQVIIFRYIDIKQANDLVNDTWTIGLIFAVEISWTDDKHWNLSRD